MDLHCTYKIAPCRTPRAYMGRAYHGNLSRQWWAARTPRQESLRRKKVGMQTAYTYPSKNLRGTSISIWTTPRRALAGQAQWTAQQARQQTARAASALGRLRGTRTVLFQRWGMFTPKRMQNKHILTASYVCPGTSWGYFLLWEAVGLLHGSLVP